MPRNRDYTLSLNRGLFNVFQKKYVVEAFDFIKERILDAEILPDKELEMYSWISEVVDEAIGKRFREHLIKQTIKSIKDAPPNTAEWSANQGL